MAAVKSCTPSDDNHQALEPWQNSFPARCDMQFHTPLTDRTCWMHAAVTTGCVAVSVTVSPATFSPNVVPLKLGNATVAGKNLLTPYVQVSGMYNKS